MLGLALCCAGAIADCRDDMALKSFITRGYELSGPLALEEIERRHMVQIEQGGTTRTVLFGRLNEKWLALRAQRASGDQFIHFRSASATWGSLAGREGYLLVRGQCVVDGIVTFVS